MDDPFVEGPLSSPFDNVDISDDIFNDLPDLSSLKAPSCGDSSEESARTSASSSSSESIFEAIGDAIPFPIQPTVKHVAPVKPLHNTGRPVKPSVGFHMGTASKARETKEEAKERKRQERLVKNRQAADRSRRRKKKEDKEVREKLARLAVYNQELKGTVASQVHELRTKDAVINKQSQQLKEFQAVLLHLAAHNPEHLAGAVKAVGARTIEAPEAAGSQRLAVRGCSSGSDSDSTGLDSVRKAGGGIMALAAALSFSLLGISGESSVGGSSVFENAAWGSGGSGGGHVLGSGHMSLVVGVVKAVSSMRQFSLVVCLAAMCAGAFMWVGASGAAGSLHRSAHSRPWAVSDDSQRVKTLTSPALPRFVEDMGAGADMEPS